ncbi:tetratricopeptide repeat protein 4-like [Lineus longissimus]|uniref:tetratricopeptide repeat protein 4-like n=1 Tax=Lineus longissimus TaxID=88925 RepID=UPI00315DF2E6
MEPSSERSLPEKIFKMAGLDLGELPVASKENAGAKCENEEDLEEDLGPEWRELMKHPFFAKEVPPLDEMTPEWEALVALKYDQNEPVDLAMTYKQDGNMYFKVKKYRSAIDHYSEGIKQRCGDLNLNCVLYCNRAMCHWYLKNYRSCLKDCLFARKFKHDHMKAIIKGAQSWNALKIPRECVKWCDEGLKIDPKNETLLELRSQAEQLKKVVDKDRRKELAKQKKREKEENDLVEAIKERGVKFEEFGRISDTKLHHLDSRHPGGGRVFLDSDGVLNWPVMFVYPEFNDTDFIQAFNENSRFVDHMEAMFGPDACPPPWDLKRQYTPQTVEIYFEDRTEKKCYQVDQTLTLKCVLQNEKLAVASGTPSFYILRKDSNFAKDFLQKYS